MFKRARRALMLATAGAVVLTVAVPAVSAQAYSVGSYYKLVNYTGGYCADITSYGDFLAADSCVQGASSQKWLLESSSDAGEYKFHNEQYGGCIQDINGEAFDSLCSGGDNTQRFALQSTSRSGYYKVVVESNGQCLTVTAAPYLAVAFEACAQGDGDQYWKLQAAS